MQMPKLSSRYFPFSLVRVVAWEAYFTKMKPNASSFLENRTFDQRLVKENLVDKWNLYGDIYKTRSDYRQFLDSYVMFNLFESIFDDITQWKAF